MRADLYINPGAYRSRHLVESMVQGFRRHGVQCVPTTGRLMETRGELCVAYGWRNKSIFNAYRKDGGHYLYIDLGYWLRKPVGKRWDGYHKVSLDSWCPSEHMRRDLPDDRFQKLKIQVGQGDGAGQSVIIAGMSEKSARHHGYAPEQWERSIVPRLQKATARTIIYRPKPSWEQARPIAGTQFQTNAGTAIDPILTSAHAIVTHHSNAAVDALVAGVPHYCEAGVGRALSMMSIADIDNAKPAPIEDRQKLLNSIAYAQWNVDEMRRGDCWEFFKAMI